MIERTYSMLAIRQFVTQPHVWRHAADDTCPSPRLYFPKIDDGNIWLLVDGHRALFYFVEMGNATWEVHIALARRAYGMASVYASRVLTWFKDNVCRNPTLVANVVPTHHLVLKLLKEVGFEYARPWGVPWMKNGEAITRDSYIYKEQ